MEEQHCTTDHRDNGLGDDAEHFATWRRYTRCFARVSFHVGTAIILDIISAILWHGSAFTHSASVISAELTTLTQQIASTDPIIIITGARWGCDFKSAFKVSLNFSNFLTFPCPTIVGIELELSFTSRWVDTATLVFITGDSKKSYSHKVYFLSSDCTCHSQRIATIKFNMSFGASWIVASERFCVTWSHKGQGAEFTYLVCIISSDTAFPSQHITTLKLRWSRSSSYVDVIETIFTTRPNSTLDWKFS
jgi:hypothetical protein